MKTQYIALATRIKQNLIDIEKVVNRAETLLDKAKQSNDDGYLDGVALNLHSFYAGIEQIFEDIARTMEKNIPSGSNWHKDLLLQMSAEFTQIRPQVISSQTRYCLNEYRAFRHIVRNIYTFNLKPTRLQELTTELSACYLTVKQDLDKFTQFLQQLAFSEEA